MSGEFIANVISTCALNFDSTECAGGIDTGCVVKLTTDCFERMNCNLATGGGGTNYC
jgi:hypothetical protein